MQKIEVKILENAAKITNFAHCKECEHYRLTSNGSQCLLEPEESTIDDCQLAYRDIYESH